MWKYVNMDTETRDNWIESTQDRLNQEFSIQMLWRWLAIGEKDNSANVWITEPLEKTSVCIE